MCKGPVVLKDGMGYLGEGYQEGGSVILQESSEPMI